MLYRSIKCAISLKKLGLQNGVVMALMAPSHLDLGVPFYAALYLGVVVSPVDRTLTTSKFFKKTFQLSI